MHLISAARLGQWGREIKTEKWVLSGKHRYLESGDYKGECRGGSDWVECGDWLQGPGQVTRSHTGHNAALWLVNSASWSSPIGQIQGTVSLEGEGRGEPWRWHDGNRKTNKVINKLRPGLVSRQGVLRRKHSRGNLNKQILTVQSQ